MSTGSSGPASHAPRSVTSWARRRGSELAVPFRHRDIRLLWGAKVSSEIGDWSARLALAYLVLDRTGSAFATAAVTAVSLAPWLGLGQVLSTLADRFTHRRVMVVSDLVRVVVFLLVAWLPMPVWTLFVLVFVAAASSPPFEAARSAALPDLAGPEHYGHALMLFNATYQAGLLIGYAAGGGLVAVAGPSWALTVNAATFALSAVLIALIRTTTRASDEPAERHWSDLRGVAEHVGAAARVYRDDPLLLTALVLLVLASMPIMAAEGLVVLYAEAYAGGGAERAGLLSAVIAAGALGAMFVLPHTGSHARLLRISATVVIVDLVVAGLLLTLAPSFLAGVVPLVLLGTLASLTVSIGTILGSRLPHASRATAFSLAQGALMSVQGGGALLAGALAETTTVAVSVALVSVPGAIWGVWALLRSRSLDDGAGTPDPDPVVEPVPGGSADEQVEPGAAPAAPPYPPHRSHRPHRPPGPDLGTWRRPWGWRRTRSRWNRATRNRARRSRAGARRPAVTSTSTTCPSAPPRPNAVDHGRAAGHRSRVTSSISHTTVDSRDAYAQSVWWATVLGYAEDPDDPNLPGHDECMIFSADGSHRVLFIEVPEAKAGKNRIHFDLVPDDGTRDEELARLLAHGATEVHDARTPDGRGWVVLADPEGNEFCILRGDVERAATP